MIKIKSNSQAEVDDSGSIKVVVGNDGGEIESAAKLTVNKKEVQKPRITGKLQVRKCS